MLRMSEIARKPPKPKIDWDAVERDYRTEAFTVTELSVKHNVSRETIVRKRKKDQERDPGSWAKDLSPQVRAATNALLLTEAVTHKVTEGHKQVTGVILAQAEVNAQVILGHRKGLQDLTTVRNLLLSQVAQAAAQLPELAEVIEMLRQPDERGIDKASDAMRKAMGRSGLVDDLKKLAEIDERVRKGEREAFGIGSEVDDAPGAKPKRLMVEFVDVVAK